LSISGKDLLLAVAQKLGALGEEVVFVGGSTIEFLVDPGSRPIRVTKDVDVLVEIATIGEYHRFANRLRVQGFSEDTSEGAPICRFRAGDLVLDVLPTEGSVLGFANRWYMAAMQNCQVVRIGGLNLKIVTAPYFVGTKLEAFHDRGGGDFVASHDLEDLVAVLDGHASLVSEIQGTDHDLREYVAEQVGRFFGDPAFLDALPGHLPGDEASQARIPVILKRLENLRDLSR
jgi:predicted nucleotidyltransferase